MDKNLEKFNSDYLETQKRMATASESQATVTSRVFWLGLLETIVAAATLYFLIRTYKETKRTADAAIGQSQIARATFVASNRPRIILREAYTNTSNGEPLKVSFTLANTGGTIGHIVTSAFRLENALPDKALRQIILDNPIASDVSPTVIAAGTAIPAGGHFEGTYSTPDITWPQSFNLSPDANGFAIIVTRQSRTTFFLSGKISYRDELGAIRNMAFYRRLTAHSLRFNPIGDSQLEYSDERA